MGRKKTILIADGLSFGRQILKLLLREQYEILEAADGDEALALLAGRPGEIAAVLLDEQLPEDGLHEVMAYLSRNDLKAKVPVLALVSTNETAVHARAYAAGAVDVIERPYHQGRILDLLANHTARFVFPTEDSGAEARARRVRGQNTVFRFGGRQ